ncbi:MAG: type IV pilus assembly protein PilM [Candidatus Omnitrophica bacterium]|jgi:type IV pilus assembly protein PilM|nr:type IV pilus assembly protein PilM [Candidatus Omnitrophota bacterium]MDD3988427.1 type IV pilus assembly protein PilM [Candidatus Omnitrophota bacterium]MDD4982008.1 type IV pilus assembly protein PilM [Candidatus Omnitrophota bacterium]MDD5665572.1 type IV pilus assembly protein PilM [Candidatus Omnitrophota bacterium]
MKNILSKIKGGLTKDKLSVGLDIGTSQIKVVKLKLNKDQAELCGFGVEPAQLDSGEVLKKLLEPHSGGPINISVSGQQSVIRYVNFPRMSSSELRQALKFEAQKHIPFSVSEVNLDGHILKDDLPDNKMLVLIAAVKKDLVSQRLKLIEGLGYRTNIIDIDSISLVNAFNFNYPLVEERDHKALAILNIGSSMTNLNILDAEIPRLSRDMHIAGSAFTQKIADIFGLEFAEAEKLKINPDEDKLNKIKAGVESALANLAGEIRTSFDYYESQGASSVGKIFLSGGSAKFNGLKEMLEHFLGTEVERWDPFKGIKMGEGIDLAKLKESRTELAVALGLALRNS